MQLSLRVYKVKIDLCEENTKQSGGLKQKETEKTTAEQEPRRTNKATETPTATNEQRTIRPEPSIKQ